MPAGTRKAWLVSFRLAVPARFSFRPKPPGRPAPALRPIALRAVSGSRSKTNAEQSGVRMKPIWPRGTSSSLVRRPLRISQDGGAEQQDVPRRAVPEVHRRRPQVALGWIARRRQRHEHGRLRHDARFRKSAVAQPDGVEEFRGAEGERSETRPAPATKSASLASGARSALAPLPTNSQVASSASASACKLAVPSAARPETRLPGRR